MIPYAKARQGGTASADNGKGGIRMSLPQHSMNTKGRPVAVVVGATSK